MLVKCLKSNFVLKHLNKENMKETVLVTGANSFIAKHLTPLLEKSYQVKLLSRSPKAANEYRWDASEKTMDERALDEVSYIIHLAGAKVNDGLPMTSEKRKRVYDSRIVAADLLRERLKARDQQLKAFVSASAIGYYGFTDTSMEIDENGAQGMGFNAELSADWEAAADRFKEAGVAQHVAKIRVSMVLGNEGGIFPMLKATLTRNPQAPIHASRESYPWNHVADMAGIFAFAMEQRLDGVYNSVAPEPASFQDIMKAISNQLHGTNYELEPFVGQHLVAKKIVKAGYVFQFPNVEAAIKDLSKN
jgi:uncharacterized protein (TIGR01777 family)